MKILIQLLILNIIDNIFYPKVCLNFSRLSKKWNEIDQCSWSDIPGKIQPMLSFATYEFIGNVTLNGTLTYQWNGCHYFEVRHSHYKSNFIDWLIEKIPPAPYNYYVTVKDNIPYQLNLPTIDRNISYIHFQNIPPPSTVFHIPNNCTKTNHLNHFLYSVYSNFKTNNYHSTNLC